MEDLGDFLLREQTERIQKFEDLEKQIANAMICPIHDPDNSIIESITIFNHLNPNKITKSIIETKHEVSLILLDESYFPQLIITLTIHHLFVIFPSKIYNSFWLSILMNSIKKFESFPFKNTQKQNQCYHRSLRNNIRENYSFQTPLQPVPSSKRKNPQFSQYLGWFS